MSLRSEFTKLTNLLGSFLRQPRVSLRLLAQVPSEARGFSYAQSMTPQNTSNHGEWTREDNPLRRYFEQHHTGRGIWKWTHYFDVYHRHLNKFIGRDARVLEIGIYSGGSLEMWRHYFGERCRIYGVDLQAACRCYENAFTEIFIGDQADSDFWQSFKDRVPTLHVLIDDGGHTPEQQIITLEEMLPHLAPGGVYICEDIHGVHNGFTAYAHGLVTSLNEMRDGGRPSPLQSLIGSIHFYTYVTVIERSARAECFTAPKHGTEWQPFSATGRTA